MWQNYKTETWFHVNSETELGSPTAAAAGPLFPSSGHITVSIQGKDNQLRVLSHFCSL